MSQFHYGSIKTSSKISLKEILGNGLNSTMVRLKLFPNKKKCVVKSKSQFHYGSIKTQELISVKFSLIWSQFHYGSIKTQELISVKFSLIWSQFHYGSIKTFDQILNLGFTVKSLNSTMVRLKHYYSIRTISCKIRSQFHYGSIKTLFVKKNFNKKSISLNSTMVRLKLTKIPAVWEQQMLCLNSTMVRLKQKLHLTCINIVIQSQFHYGSIKTDLFFFHQLYCRLVGLNSTMVRLKQ